jgi:hypothetical protein
MVGWRNLFIFVGSVLDKVVVLPAPLEMVRFEIVSHAVELFDDRDAIVEIAVLLALAVDGSVEGILALFPSIGVVIGHVDVVLLLPQRSSDELVLVEQRAHALVLLLHDVALPAQHLNFRVEFAVVLAQLDYLPLVVLLLALTQLVAGVVAVASRVAFDHFGIVLFYFVLEHAEHHLLADARYRLLALKIDPDDVLLEFGDFGVQGTVLEVDLLVGDLDLVVLDQDAFDGQEKDFEYISESAHAVIPGVVDDLSLVGVLVLDLMVHQQFFVLATAELHVLLQISDPFPQFVQV